VIPKKLRAGFEDGTPFAVIRDRDSSQTNKTPWY
jgi:hypothetical protein